MYSIATACAAHGCADAKNVHKRHLIHVAWFNLGLLMLALFGAVAPRRNSYVKTTLPFVYQAD
jgi:hypothetical protein